MGKEEFKPLIKLPFFTIHMGDIPVVAVSMIAGFVIAKLLK